jgi:predicted kinase
MLEAVRADVFVVTGAMAAGKSTVAELLAQRFERAVHLRGDVFRKMIVRGRDPLGPELGSEALAQLALRRRLATSTALEYHQAGFTVVLQDIYIGEALSQVVTDLEVTPLYVVVLVPRPAVIAQREQARSKQGYVDWDVEAFSQALERETPRLGLWLDSSDLSPDQTVQQILLRLDEARVR